MEQEAKDGLPGAPPNSVPEGMKLLAKVQVALVQDPAGVTGVLVAGSLTDPFKILWLLGEAMEEVRTQIRAPELATTPLAPVSKQIVLATGNVPRTGR